MNKRHLVIALAGILLAFTMTFTLESCGGRNGSMENVVREAFINGDTTQQRFDSICGIITANPEAYRDYIGDDGMVDVQKLNEFINNVGQKLRPPMTWNVLAYGAHQTLSLTVYFERSGSMVPYDTPDGGGQLKKAVNDLLNNFPDNKEIKIVNNDIYPYSGTIDEFLKDRNIYATTKDVGNASYTDFQLIFDKILDSQKPGNVSVLVSDMIYSPADTKNVSAEKIFNEENSVATAIFKKYKNKAVIVQQFFGDYHGKYYPYNGTPVQYNGKRPFYLIIIADAATLNYIAAHPEYNHILNPDDMRNSYRFNQAQSELKYKVIADWKDNAGRFREARDGSGTLTKCEGDRVTGKLCFSIAVNLKSLQKNDEFLTNPDNYNVGSQSNFTIAVKPISQGDITSNNRTWLEGNTHIITFAGKMDTRKDEITVALRNDYPMWISQASALDDTNIDDVMFPVQTFGLDFFMRGIYNAFNTGNDKYVAFKINLEK